MAEAYTVLIPCPEHPEGTHTAFLYQSGHKYAGIWECPVSGASDSCEHEESHVETVEFDTMRDGEHDTYETHVYVCDACDEYLEGDPVQDAYEDREDY